MKTSRIRWVLCLVPVAAAMGCDDGTEPPAGAYVALQELDQTQQPATQSLGVLVDVVASGGNVVRLEALGGVFANGNTSTLCINFPNPGINTTVVSVLPAQTEALVTAYLGNRATAEAGGAPSASTGPSGEGTGDGSAGDAEAGDAGLGDAATTDAGASGDAGAPMMTTPSIAPPLPPLDPGCAQTTFVAEDVSSSLVVSIGRAPAPPLTPPPDAATIVDSGPDADATLSEDAEAGVDATSSNEAGEDAEPSSDATTDAAGKDADAGTEDGGDAS